MGRCNGEGAGYDKLAPILDYGLLKERFAALLTDGLRAKYLEQSGYETQVLEFIDMEHTPKKYSSACSKDESGKTGGVKARFGSAGNFWGLTQCWECY